MESNVVLPLPIDCTYLDRKFATTRNGCGAHSQAHEKSVGVISGGPGDAAVNNRAAIQLLISCTVTKVFTLFSHHVRCDKCQRPTQGSFQ